MSEVAERSDIITVTPETFNAYVDEKMAQPETPEVAAAKEFEKVEAEKAERIAQEKDEEDPTHDLGENVPKDKKGRLNARFSELTEKRKAAEKAAEEARQEAQKAREEREAIQRERDELHAKLNPPKPAERLPKPKPEQFTDANEYGKALEEWTKDDTERTFAENQAKKEAEKRAAEASKQWADRVKAVSEEIPDYKETIEKSDVRLSDQAAAAIHESEVGPKILYHFSQNPEEAVALGKMSVPKMLITLGKLEAKLGAEPKSQTEGKPVAHISKAPAPITPLKGAGAPVGGNLTGRDKFVGTYDEWKKLYDAGKIKEWD